MNEIEKATICKSLAVLFGAVDSLVTIESIRLQHLAQDTPDSFPMDDLKRMLELAKTLENYPLQRTDALNKITSLLE